MTIKELCVTACIAALPAVVLAEGPEQKAPKNTTTVSTEAVQPTAISGLASSGRHCVGPSGAVVHSIGWVPANSRVTITFQSDFDPVAAITLTALGTEAPDRVARTAMVGDDDTGGNLEPLLNFTTSFAGTLALHVSKYSAERSAGCYFYKVEIITG